MNASKSPAKARPRTKAGEGEAAVSKRAPAAKRTRATAKPSRAEDGEDSVSQAFMSFLLTSDSKSGVDEGDAIASVHLIHRITPMMRRSSTAIAEKAGIHVSDLYVLLLLHRRPPEYQAMSGELQRALGFTSGGITRRVDRLEEVGLVERVPHATDRRIWIVKLTPAGLKMVRKSRSSTASTKINDLIRQLEASEWKHLLAMLRLIDKSLSASEPGKA